MSTPPTYSLFPNGTAFMCWNGRNCDRCKKGPAPDIIGNNPLCEIEDAIALASCLDGKLTLDGTKTAEEAAALAARLKWDGQSYLETDCPEFEPRP